MYPSSIPPYAQYQDNHSENTNYSEDDPEALKKGVDFLEERLRKFNQEIRKLGRTASILSTTRQISTELKEMMEAYEAVVKNEKDDCFETLAQRFHNLADSLQNFRLQLRDFKEYSDEGSIIRVHLGVTAENLMYLSAWIRHYGSKQDKKEQSIYIRPDKLKETVIGYSKNVTIATKKLGEAVEHYIETGIPAIGHEQQRESTTLLNILSSATFFSGVTATTLQMSMGTPATSSIEAVNACWYCSLVFSIGAALNSVISMAWSQTRSGSRGGALPFYVRMWVYGSPTVFLAVSIGLFLAGLVLFVFSSNQAKYTPPIVSTAVALTLAGFFTISIWSGYEHWPVQQDSSMDKAARREEVIRKHGLDPFPWLKNSSEISLPQPGPTNQDATTDFLETLHPRPFWDLRRWRAKMEREIDYDPEKQPKFVQQARRGNKIFTKGWKKTTEKMVVLRNAATARLYNTPGLLNKPDDTPKVNQPEQKDLVYTKSFTITPTEDLDQYTVSHLKFSPNADYIAYSLVRKDKTESLIFVHDVEKNEKDIKGTVRGDAKQIIWSPKSQNKILIRLWHGVALWKWREQNTVPVILRQWGIRSVGWRTDDTFLFVEDNYIYECDENESVKLVYSPPENFSPRDVAAVPDKNYLIIIGQVLLLPKGMDPRPARWGQIKVFNMDTKTDICKRDILQPVDEVRVKSNGTSGCDILLSHKNKAPPELWRFKYTMNGENGEERLDPGELVLSRPYNPLRYATPPSFAGKKNETILSGSFEETVMDVWKLVGEQMIHRRIPLPSGGKEHEYGKAVLGCFAWADIQHANKSIIFARTDPLKKEIWCSRFGLTSKAEFVEDEDENENENKDKDKDTYKDEDEDKDKDKDEDEDEVEDENEGEDEVEDEESGGSSLM